MAASQESEVVTEICELEAAILTASGLRKKNLRRALRNAKEKAKALRTRPKHSLPNEAWFEVFKWLDLHSLRACQRVNAALCMAALDEMQRRMPPAEVYRQKARSYSFRGNCVNRTAFDVAAEAGDVAIMADLAEECGVGYLVAGHGPGHADPSVPQRALQLSAVNGHFGCVEWLVTRGVPVPESVIRKVVIAGQWSIVLWLVDLLPDSESTDLRIVRAARDGDAGAVNDVLKHAYVHSAAVRMAIICASVRGQTEVLTFFRHSLRNSILDPLRNSVLHLAAQHGHVDAVNFLLETGALDPHLKNTFKQTALGVARAHKQHDVVQLLKTVPKQQEKNGIAGPDIEETRATSKGGRKEGKRGKMGKRGNKSM